MLPSLCSGHVHWLVPANCTVRECLAGCYFSVQKHETCIPSGTWPSSPAAAGLQRVAKPSNKDVVTRCFLCAAGDGTLVMTGGEWGRSTWCFCDKCIKVSFLLFYSLGLMTEELWSIWPLWFGLYLGVREAMVIAKSELLVELVGETNFMSWGENIFLCKFPQESWAF